MLPELARGDGDAGDAGSTATYCIADSILRVAEPVPRTQFSRLTLVY